MDEGQDSTVSVPASYSEQKVFKWAASISKATWEWSVIGDINKYVALSHTWGAEEDLLQTTLVGVEVQVSLWKRDNLANWIQKTLPDTWVWMDILCIPQYGDQRFKAACLQCIPQIYQAAACVHVLLEDQASLVAVPTYEEFDEDHLRTSTPYRETIPEARQLPVMDLLTRWFKQNKVQLPTLAWMQRFWTRQEAQYASQICFHGCGPTEDHVNCDLRIQTESLGPMGQLASSMVVREWSVMCRILIELVAARGTQIAGLEGRIRQQAGGPVMAFRELRAARRTTKKSQDYVLALFPTFDWYIVPESARTQSTLCLLSDALRQFERAKHCVVLRPTMDGIFSSVRPILIEGQEYMFQTPRTSFDFFSTLTTIGHRERRIDGSVDLVKTDEAEIVEWSIQADTPIWAEVLAAVCIEKAIKSLERLYAMEALIKELSITGFEQSALRDFVLARDAGPLATLKNRKSVIMWISCIHSILSHRELKRVVNNGAKLMLIKAKGQPHPYPAIVATSWEQGDTVSVFVAPDVDAPSADIAFLGHVEVNKKCRLVGSLGSYVSKYSSTQPKTYYSATNAWDFWTERSQASLQSG